MNYRYRKVFTKSRSLSKTLMLVLLIGLMAVMSACAKDEPAESEILEPSEVIVEEDTSLFAEGTTIAEQDISGKTVEEALEIGRTHLKGKLDELEISVKFQEDTVTLRGDDFAFQDVLDLALPELLEDRKPGDYEIQHVMDLSEAGETKLNEAAQGCYVQGGNATVTGYDSESGAFTFADEVAGVRVDLNQTLESVRQLLAKKHGGALQAEFLEENPTVEKANLADNFQVMASYSTVSTNTENGNINMKLALDHINGTVLEPGEVFAFNTVIGDSTTTENGYLPAGGISSGVMVQLIGGGICQGSSTVYGAVIRAGLEIVERHCHGIQSSYCPTGQDAMVDYGSADLRFKNNYDTPIYIMSSMQDTTLYVSIYGVQPAEWDTVEIYSETVATHPPLTTPRYDTDSSLAAGETKLKSSGRKGYESIASRTYYKDGVAIRTEDLPYSVYPASPDVYASGPGANTSGGGGSTQSGNNNTSNNEPQATPQATPAPTPTPEEPTPAPTPTPESQETGDEQGGDSGGEITE